MAASALPILKCDRNEIVALAACPGASMILANVNSSCGFGYRGVLCGSCLDNHMLKASGECAACGTWNVLGMLAAVAGCVVAVFLALHIRSWLGMFQSVEMLANYVMELKLNAIGKIFVATMQILGGLPQILNVRVPQIFQELLATFVSFFQFNITISLGLGCLTHGKYVLTMAGNVGLILLVLFSIWVDFQWKVRKARRTIPSEDERTEMLRSFFQKVDKNGSGVELPELKRMCERIDPSISAETVDGIFTMADADKSGSIDFDEFEAAIVGGNGGNGGNGDDDDDDDDETGLNDADPPTGMTKSEWGHLNLYKFSLLLCAKLLVQSVF